MKQTEIIVAFIINNIYYKHQASTNVFKANVKLIQHKCVRMFCMLDMNCMIRDPGAQNQSEVSREYL